MAWTMPLFVACSTFGAVNGGIFASARLFFVGARNGHMPRAMGLINVNNVTPMPCLIFLVSSLLFLTDCDFPRCFILLIFIFSFYYLVSQGLCSLAMLITDDVYVLINYTSFIESLFITVSVAGLLWLRYKEPELERPIKVNFNASSLSSVVVC